MIFQDIVNSVGMAASIISVEKKDDDHYGEIRIVCANAKYKETMGSKYYDNMLYTELTPQEPNFEDFCFRCAVKKQHLHAYVDTKSLGLWTDGNYIPLSPDLDTETHCYYMFTFEFTTVPEAEKLSDISMETAPFIIQTCINLRGAKDFSECMNKVISDIQKKTESFCSSIIMIDKAKQKYAPLCSKFRNDEACMDDFMPYLTPEVVFSWEDTIQFHDQIIIKDDFDMDNLEKINPVWVKSLRSGGVKSLILAPLSQGKKMFGVLFITNFNTENIVKLKDFIKLTAFFLSSEIANNDLMEKLEYMSNVDLLTGVRNRNSMNSRIDWHISNDFPVHIPYGVVFADLNGLKQINDKGGHEAGDIYLKQAAEKLKEYFGAYEIYRSGGDEFVVIAPNCPQEKFEQMVEELKESSLNAENTNDVSFAIGSAWSTESKKLRYCMHIADEAMYADKEEYYKRNPDKIR